MIQTLPSEILSYLTSKYGAPVAASDMGGINPGEVYKIDFKLHSFIVKKVPHKREIDFYEKMSPFFNAHGIPAPFLEWSGSAQKLPWIIIENIPSPLPEHRWEADDEVIGYLAKVHQLKNYPAIENLYRPTWDEKMNKRVLDCFDPKDHRKLEDLLGGICQKSQHLFEPTCLISGDPNPKNWGLRADGSLVQFDWQHIGLGSPALDLAVSICSSENHKTCQLVANMYLAHCHDEELKAKYPPAILASSIILGCAWNYVRFLDRYMAGKINVPEKVIDHIAEFFPDWINFEINKKVA